MGKEIGKEVSRGQALQIAGRTAMQTRWDEIDSDRLQLGVINLSPDEFGRRMTDFFKNNCQINDKQLVFKEPEVLFPRPFKPEFLHEELSIWKGSIDGDGKRSLFAGKEEIDQRSLSLDKVYLSNFVFTKCLNLREEEKSITKEESLRRLKEERIDLVLPAGNIFWEFWTDYESHKENSALEHFYRIFKIISISFPGLIMRGPNGSRCIPHLYRWTFEEHPEEFRWEHQFRHLHYHPEIDEFWIGYKMSENLN